MSSALTIPARGTKNAATVCHRHSPLNWTSFLQRILLCNDVQNGVHHALQPCKQLPVHQGSSLFCLLAAGMENNRQWHNRFRVDYRHSSRGFKSQSRPALALKALQMQHVHEDECASKPSLDALKPNTANHTSNSNTMDKSLLNRPKRLHPRHISKKVNIDHLLDHLEANKDALGPKRVFKALRSALYNACGNNDRMAWRIYEAMLHHEVVHLMLDNHFGHLLNVLKYGGGVSTVDRMLAVLDQIRKVHGKVGELCYSQVLFAQSRHGNVKGAMSVLRCMQQEGLSPGTSHYMSLAVALQASSPGAAVTEEAADLMIEAMKNKKTEISKEACAIMISVLARNCQDLNKAIEFLECVDQMDVSKNNDAHQNHASKPNRFMYTSLISAFAQKGDTVNAQRLFDEMRRRRLRPTTVTYTALLEAYGRAGDFDTAIKLLKQYTYSRAQGKLNHVMSTSILTNAVRHGRLDIAQKLVHTWLHEMNVDPMEMDDRFRAAVLWVKAKTELEDARQFFDELYAKNPRSVNDVMVNHLVSSSGDTGDRNAVDEAFDLHKLLSNENISMRSQAHYVDALFKCRDVPAALSAFVKMRQQNIPDDITMAMVIRGLVMNNEDEMAWRIFRVLKAGGLEPNLHAYTSMLKSFARGRRPKNGPSSASSLWPKLWASITDKPESAVPLSYPALSPSSQVYKIFQEMTGFHKPNVYAYTTLISCFAKSNIGRAVDIFTHMCADGVQPTAATYTALLQGCAIFRNAQMALMVFQHMTENNIEPNLSCWRYLLKAMVRSRVSQAEIDRIGAIANKALEAQHIVKPRRKKQK